MEVPFNNENTCEVVLVTAKCRRLAEEFHQRHKSEDELVAPNCGDRAHTQYQNNVNYKRQSAQHQHSGCENCAEDEPQEDRHRTFLSALQASNPFFRFQTLRASRLRLATF